MQYFIYVYNEADRRSLENLGLPMMHDRSDPWCKSTPYVFLVNGAAGKDDTERIMSGLSKTAVLSNRMFFAGVFPGFAGRSACTQEVLP